MTFTRQKDFDEIAHHAELNQLARVFALMHRNVRIGRVGGLAPGNEILLPKAAGHLGKRKGLDPALHVPPRITVRKPSYKQLVDRGAGDDSELTEPRHRLGQAPIGNAYSHPPLYDFGKIHHLWILSQIPLFAATFSYRSGMDGIKTASLSPNRDQIVQIMPFEGFSAVCARPTSLRSQLLAQKADHMIGLDNAHHPPQAINHRKRVQIVLVELLCQFVLVPVRWARNPARLCQH